MSMSFPRSWHTSTASPARVAKVLGADVELGNFIEGLDADGGTAALASRRLLDEIPGIPAARRTPWVHLGAAEPLATDGRRGDPQDWGRRFLPTNGGCVYIDLDHLELAQPETSNAFDFVASARAMLGTARSALDRVNGRMNGRHRVVAMANCSDGLGHSFGAHVNVLVTRRAWENVCVRKPHYLAYLAAFQASSIVYTGAGKVGRENGRAPVAYQISQRADFIETLVGPQTTHQRPLVNTRDEPLCGPRAWRLGDADDELSRLHVIFHDHTLAQVATLLKAGTLQIVAAMLEAGAIDVDLALEDPLAAVLAWSADPTLSSRAPTVAGEAVTAVNLQLRFLDDARRFADDGGLDDTVPRAAEIISLWHDTLIRLRAGDLADLARRLDWVLKRQILERSMDRYPSLDWASPEIKHLDQLYASLDHDDGLFWAYERDGLLDRVVSDDAIALAGAEPPADTRAWTRTQLLRLAGEDRIDGVDWDAVRVRFTRRARSGDWPMCRTIDLTHPAGATRAEHGALFERGPALEDVVVVLARGDRIGVERGWPGPASHLIDGSGGRE